MYESINIHSLMRECLKCGKEFIPDESGEECCSGICDAVYYGWGNRDWDWDDCDWNEYSELED